MQDFKIPDLQRHVAEGLAGGRERDLDESGRRKHRRVLDAMIGEPWENRGIDGCVPRAGAGPRCLPKQRMRIRCECRQRFAGPLDLEATMLPDVIRKLCQRPLRGTSKTVDIDPSTCDQCARRAREYLVFAIRFPGQRGNCSTLHARASQRFVQIAAKDRVRADFKEHAGAVLDQRRDTAGKIHRLAHIAPPIAGVEPFAGERHAGHGGHERYP